MTQRSARQIKYIERPGEPSFGAEDRRMLSRVAMQTANEGSNAGRRHPEQRRAKKATHVRQTAYSKTASLGNGLCYCSGGASPGNDFDAENPPWASRCLHQPT